MTGLKGFLKKHKQLIVIASAAGLGAYVGVNKAVKSLHINVCLIDK